MRYVLHISCHTHHTLYKLLFIFLPKGRLTMPITRKNAATRTPAASWLREPRAQKMRRPVKITLRKKFKGIQYLFHPMHSCYIRMENERTAACLMPVISASQINGTGTSTSVWASSCRRLAHIELAAVTLDPSAHSENRTQSRRVLPECQVGKLTPSMTKTQVEHGGYRSHTQARSRQTSAILLLALREGRRTGTT